MVTFGRQDCWSEVLSGGFSCGGDQMNQTANP
jgi:hypothetical protein